MGFPSKIGVFVKKLPDRVNVRLTRGLSLSGSNQRVKLREQIILLGHLEIAEWGPGARGRWLGAKSEGFLHHRFQECRQSVKSGQRRNQIPSRMNYQREVCLPPSAIRHRLRATPLGMQGRIGS